MWPVKVCHARGVARLARTIHEPRRGGALGRRGEEQGRNRYTLHSFRRFAAKRWLESGLNIRQVQLLLGHEDLQTTMGYLNYDLDEIARAAESVTFGLSTPGDGASRAT